MKIAVASEGNVVTGHFGHCQNFWIYTAENGVITAEENVENPGHKPGFLPNFLADRGVNVIICGGMGAHASEIFGQRNVETITGAEGDSKTAAERYLKGELHSTGAVCREHHHGEHHSE